MEKNNHAVHYHAHPPTRHRRERGKSIDGVKEAKEKVTNERSGIIPWKDATEGNISGGARRRLRNEWPRILHGRRIVTDNPSQDLQANFPGLPPPRSTSLDLGYSSCNAATVGKKRLSPRVTNIPEEVQRHLSPRGRGGRLSRSKLYHEAGRVRDKMPCKQNEWIPAQTPSQTAWIYSAQTTPSFPASTTPRTPVSATQEISSPIQALSPFSHSEISRESADSELDHLQVRLSDISVDQPWIPHSVNDSASLMRKNKTVTSDDLDRVRGHESTISGTRNPGNYSPAFLPVFPDTSELDQPVSSILVPVSGASANSDPDSGPSGPPLRNVTNTSSSQTSQSQRGISSSSRLSTNKTGSGSSWGNASLLQSQTRDNSVAGQMDTYAQTVNGQQQPQQQQQQQNRTLNFSSEEYPSLGEGSSQLQNQLPGTSSVWGSRPTQQSQSQRQQMPSGNAELSTSRPRPSDRDGAFGANPGQPQILTRQQQTGSNSNESPRRSNTLQSDGYQTSAFGPRGPPGIDGQRSVMDGRDPDRLTSPASAGGVSSSRSPIGQVINGSFAQERTSGAPGGLSSIGQRVVSRNNNVRIESGVSDGEQASSHDAFAGRPNVSSPSSIEQQGDQSLEETLGNMSEKDRWGLPGFFAAYQDPYTNRLMRGQDLSTLGLRMEQSEPLHQRFLGPFASERAVPRPLETEYTVPACYTVQNVVPLQQRINGFTEETLFYIFYTMPRDITQELVAEELMGRKWRFHLREKMWLTRDENAPAPVEIEPGVSESGTYLWWNPNVWRRERRQYLLRYDELDDHLQRSGAVNAAANTAGANGGAMAGFNAVPGLERMAAGMGRNF